MSTSHDTDQRKVMWIISCRDCGPIAVRHTLEQAEFAADQERDLHNDRVEITHVVVTPYREEREFLVHLQVQWLRSKYEATQITDGDVK